eukprot:2020233-Lingulodinium_polyedra.AAC.1
MRSSCGAPIGGPGRGSSSLPPRASRPSSGLRRRRCPGQRGCAAWLDARHRGVPGGRAVS